MPQIISPPESKIPEKRPIITTCPHCQYTISYTEDEVERVSSDGNGILCPHCEEPIVFEYIKPFTFPDSFYHFGMNEGAICLDERKVQEFVDIVKNKLQQECDTNNCYAIGSGNTMVFGFRHEDEDVIYVAQNYWEDSIDRY